MKSIARMAAPLAMAGALSACSLGGLLGGGAKAPLTLLTLTPEVADPGSSARAASAGQAISVQAPTLPKELREVRVPVQTSPTDIQYVTGLQMVDTPDHLFQALLAETIRRTTNRVVLDNAITTVDPGLIVSGQLQHFGFDAQTGQVFVEYDGVLSTTGGTRVETRRFVARQPADGTPASVGPALNRAANDVAQQAAQWIAAARL